MAISFSGEIVNIEFEITGDGSSTTMAVELTELYQFKQNVPRGTTIALLFMQTFGNDDHVEDNSWSLTDTLLEFEVTPGFTGTMRCKAILSVNH